MKISRYTETEQNASSLQLSRFVLRVTLVRVYRSFVLSILRQNRRMLRVRSLTRCAALPDYFTQVSITPLSALDAAAAAAPSSHSMQYCRLSLHYLTLCANAICSAPA